MDGKQAEQPRFHNQTQNKRIHRLAARKGPVITRIIGLHPRRRVETTLNLWDLVLAEKGGLNDNAGDTVRICESPGIRLEGSIVWNG